MARVTRNITRRKVTGAHFTPPELALLLARRILAHMPETLDSSTCVLDPSCGDGELLLAIYGLTPAAVRDRLSLVGIESDSSAAERAIRRLTDLGADRVELAQRDFLDIHTIPPQPSLFDDLALQPGTDPIPPANVVIANPPYVRTQVLGARTSQLLAKRFGLRGRVDLYHAFIIGMTAALAPSGILGMITSNRFLSTKAGATVRRFLSENYDILELIDLGDTKLFDAAVLPAIFIGRKRHAPDGCHGHTQQTRFKRIYEQTGRTENGNTRCISLKSIYEVFQQHTDGVYQVKNIKYSFTSGILALPERYSEPWTLTTADESDWLSLVNKNSIYSPARRPVRRQTGLTAA
jgi:adenine-specific DNA-methyltransferase